MATSPVLRLLRTAHHSLNPRPWIDWKPVEYFTWLALIISFRSSLKLAKKASQLTYIEGLLMCFCLSVQVTIGSKGRVKNLYRELLYDAPPKLAQEDLAPAQSQVSLYPCMGGSASICSIYSHAYKRVIHKQISKRVYMYEDIHTYIYIHIHVHNYVYTDVGTNIITNSLHVYFVNVYVYYVCMRMRTFVDTQVHYLEIL